MPQPEFHFEWDPRKATTNARKHRVSFERAATIFRDSEALSLYDGTHSDIVENEHEKRIRLLQGGARKVLSSRCKAEFACLS